MYVTGNSSGTNSQAASYFATVAYDAATGAERWAARFGTTTSDNEAVGGEYTTIAYAAATGARLWLAQSPIAGGGFATPASVAISPDGAKLAITGSSRQASSYSAAVLDAATGARLWLATYQDPGGAPTQAAGVVFSHSGAQVVVTGSSVPASGPSEFATVAYQS